MTEIELLAAATELPTCKLALVGIFLFVAPAWNAIDSTPVLVAKLFVGATTEMACAKLIDVSDGMFPATKVPLTLPPTSAPTVSYTHLTLPTILRV